MDWLDPAALLDQFGDYALWGAAAIVFAECGLLVGFFLPGESLLFAVGMLVAHDKVSYPLWLACLILFIASVLGNACGYAIGRRFGPSVFGKEDSRLFKKEYVDKTHAFFERYGSRAIVLARFVPVARTFVTVMAGVAGMSFRRFMTYSAIGGLAWAAGVAALGYYLGSIPVIRDNVELMILSFVAIAVAPIAIEILRERASRRFAGMTDE